MLQRSSMLNSGSSTNDAFGHSISRQPRPKAKKKASTGLSCIAVCFSSSTPTTEAGDDGSEAGAEAESASSNDPKSINICFNSYVQFCAIHTLVQKYYTNRVILN